MMFGPFRVSSPFGAGFGVDTNDTLKTKYALRGIGYYQPNNHGMSQYPDRGIFDSLRKFQKDHGLRVDGVIKPGGETERTLRAVTNAMEQKYNDGPYVTTVAIADAAVAVNTTVVALTTVAVASASPDEQWPGDESLSGRLFQSSFMRQSKRS